MKTFTVLKAIHDFRREHLPFLRTLGAVFPRADHDKRNVHLTLSPKVWTLYARMGRLMRKILI